MNYKLKYSCDFETTTDREDARVWAWIAINIDNEDEKEYGNSIETFFDWMQAFSKEVYFHNLKFDGSYIIDFAFRNGYKHNENERKVAPHEFNCLISDKGYFYTMYFNFGISTVKIIDSLKILPYSVDAIAKGWNLPLKKLELDYETKREKGHILTQHEIDYITNDALIIAKALKILFSQGFKKITAGSNAFHYYQELVGGKKSFRKMFPIPDNDAYIRKAYRGGYVYVNPKFQNKVVSAGRVYDVNSLYPWALHSPNLYPYGKPVYFTGEYIADENYPLYVQQFYCSFKLKPGYLPTIQRKNTPGYIPTEYLTESIDDSYPLFMTSIDKALFFEHYEVSNYRPIDGYKYKARAGMFDEYVDYWYRVKAESKHEKNYAMYQLSKLFMNSLYGKFATNPNICSRYPYMGKDNIVHYYAGEPETKEPIYIAVGVFCTAYARNLTIRSAQKCFDRFIYADTDSLHLLKDIEASEIEIDDFKLGAFKHESSFSEAKFIRPKLYIEKETFENQWKVTGAGMTPAIKAQVNLDNFNTGNVFSGKLRQVTVPGGIVLEKTTFTIRK